MYLKAEICTKLRSANRNDVDCVDSCPCHADCMIGCQNCANPICLEAHEDPVYEEHGVLVRVASLY